MKTIIIALLSLISVQSYAFESGLYSAGPSSDANEFFSVATAVDYQPLLTQAEQTASSEGKMILEMADKMLADKTVVVGSCWDYANEVYERAGFPETKQKDIFEGEQLQGPYAAADMIQPGDLLTYINHSFGNVDHSAIFVAWTDVTKLQALMVSYAGQDQAVPARLKVYDLSNVFSIIRPQAL